MKGITSCFAISLMSGLLVCVIPLNKFTEVERRATVLLQNLTAAFQISKTILIFFVYVQLLISKREGIISIRALYRFKAKLKTDGSAVPLLSNNKSKQSQYS